MERKIFLINKIMTWKLTLLVGLIPFFFLPFTSDFYDFNKNILLLVCSLLLTIIWLLKMVLEKKVSFRRTVFDLPVLAIAGAFILSTIIAAPNKLETLWLVNGTGTVIALTLLYFFITNNLKKKDQTKILTGFIISGLVLSLIAIYQFIGLGETFISNNSFFTFLKAKSWTPAGNLLSLAIFLIVVFYLLAIKTYKAWQERRKDLMVLWLNGFMILLVAAGLALALYQLFTSAKPLLLPYSTGWAISVEAFKNGKIFLFGVGPRSFLDAFSQSRPLSYNLTSLWAVRFNNSSNFYLQLITTVGLLGLASWLYLILKVIKNRPFSILHYLIFILLIFFLFLPANFLLLFVFYVLVSLIASRLSVREYHEEGRVLTCAISVPLLLLILSSLFFIGRAYAAEVFFNRSLNNISRNEGTNAYNNQIKAISLNPYNDIYRISYSQTNLLLADALARKSDISDQDRQNITTLVQQSIREAKVAVSLNKNKITDWENLANIYRQLINFAEGADQWTITTLRQAINLDPINPELKLRLGGVYYALGNYDEAIRWFQQSVDSKPNFANGYYNLSAAYKEKGDFKKAHEMMQTTLTLIPTDSSDYQKARGELEGLAKQLPAEETTPSAETQTPAEVPAEIPLNQPETLPSPVINPPLELPEQSGPEINPAPEATP